MSKRTLIIMNLILLLTILGASIISYQMWQEKQLQENITQLLDRMDQTYEKPLIAKKRKRQQDRIITSYFPKTEQGDLIISIKEVMNQDTLKISTKKKEGEHLRDFKVVSCNRNIFCAGATNRR